MRCAAISTALVAALALAGCAGSGGSSDDSSKDFEGDRKLVANTVEDLQSSATDRDGSQICRDLITAKLQQEISQNAEGTACSAAVEEAVKDSDSADLEVRSVTINGTTATAVVRADLGDDKFDDRTMSFEKQAGRWKISGFGS